MTSSLMHGRDRRCLYATREENIINTVEVTAAAVITRCQIELDPTVRLRNALSDRSRGCLRFEISQKLWWTGLLDLKRGGFSSVWQPFVELIRAVNFVTSCDVKSANSSFQLRISLDIDIAIAPTRLLSSRSTGAAVCPSERHKSYITTGARWCARDVGNQPVHAHEHFPQIIPETNHRGCTASD